MLNIGLLDFLIPLKYDIILDNLPLFGLLVTIAWLASSLLDFAVGGITDKLGIKRTIQIGIVFSFIGSLVFGFSKNFLWMTFGVFLWGLSYIILAVPSETYVLSAFPKNYRGSAYGWMFFFYDIAYAIAPLLGLLLFSLFNMDSTIIASAIIVLFTLPALSFALKSKNRKSMIGAVEDVVYKDGFILKELKDIKKMNFKEISLAFNIFVCGLWFMVIMIGAPLLFFHGKQDLFHGALLAFAFMLPLAITGLIYGKMANSPKRRNVMIKIGFILSAILLIVFYFIQNFAVLMLLAFIITLVANMGWTGSAVEISRYLPDGRKGEFMGIFLAAKDIGFDLAPLFYGLFASVTLKVPFFVLGILLFLAGLVYMIANRK